MVFGKKRSDSTSKINNNESENIPELVLPFSKLRFCSDQLQNLNYIFTRNSLHEPDLEYGKSVLLAGSVTERLVQRLVCGVGILDSRFSSKFLVSLHDPNSNKPSTTLEYIIRLDSLSLPSLYPNDESPRYSITEGDLENCPHGYAGIRPHPPFSKAWAEFINPSGYLRRDRIQSKVAELVAQAASGNSPVSSLLVDESLLCGSPGKVVDAFTLHNILLKSPNQQVFYGDAGKNPRFPDPRDFKLAIMDKPSGIVLRIGFLSPALATITIEVRLLVAIGLNAWPSTTSFPFRISLNHADSLLYHRAAQTGMYLVGYGVHSAAWQIRLPAAERFLENHYSKTSAISTICQTLCGIPRDIDEEYRRHQVVYKILNRYTMRTCALYQLEEDSTSLPTEIVLNWSSLHVSTIVLSVLDKLINSLRCQNQPNYFFPAANLFSNPGHLCEDDFLLESNKIKAYMLKLFDVSLTSLNGTEDFDRFLGKQKIEWYLLRKWKELVEGLVVVDWRETKPRCCRRLKGRRVDMHAQYTSRQVEYIGIVLKNMLSVKHYVLQTPDEIMWAAVLKVSDSLKENPIEDIIYILASIVQQARDEYVHSLPKNPKTSKNLPMLKRKIEEATSNLLDSMRKENDVADLETIDDALLVHVILKWLYKGLESNKKTSLRKVLRPYLKKLYASSHGSSCFLEVIQRKDASEEANSLGVFAALVNAGKITPAQGLVDSVVKNWTWAKDMLSVLDEGQIRLLFIPERGKVSKHILSLPPKNKTTLSKSANDVRTDSEARTLNRGQCCFSTLLLNSQSGRETVKDYVPPHCMLREGSPMRLNFSKFNRSGEHRCCGDVLATLLAMQKVSVMNEVSALLPNEERLEILEAIQKFQTEKNRSFKKFKSATFNFDREKYTSREESAGIRENVSEKRRRWHKVDADDGDKTLIGSCRAARLREDNSILQFQDNFKMQTLLKHSSFKY